jgi:D-3-phosphoglycerate dehydrogenase
MRLSFTREEGVHADMKKVLIPTKLDTVAAKILTGNGNYTVVQDDSIPLPELASANQDAYAIIVRSEKVTAEVIDALPELKVVVRAGAGFNTIDIEHARSKGVDVMNTPGANANAVAEEVVAMMLADVRHIVKADPSTRQGKWEKKSFVGREITGKTVGIIGLGAIGQLVAKRLSGFDVTLIGYDPIVPAERAKEFNVDFKSIEDIFREADFVTLHVPENDATRKMVGENLLSLMKPGATIVNCARSGIVDEQALREAKASKGIRFLNDVYDKDAEGEKSIADFAELMLPHLGASTVEAGFNAATRAAEEIIELDEQGVTKFIVNA